MFYFRWRVSKISASGKAAALTFHQELSKMEPAQLELPPRNVQAGQRRQSRKDAEHHGDNCRYINRGHIGRSAVLPIGVQYSY